MAELSIETDFWCLGEIAAIQTCFRLDISFLGTCRITLAGIDMLAKYYYKFASVWVVFFVFESNVCIVFYNAFMSCLEVWFGNVYQNEKDQNGLQQFDEILGMEVEFDDSIFLQNFWSWV